VIAEIPSFNLHIEESMIQVSQKGFQEVKQQ
jgi:hypothetical protein